MPIPSCPFPPGRGSTTSSAATSPMRFADSPAHPPTRSHPPPDRRLTTWSAATSPTLPSRAAPAPRAGCTRRAGAARRLWSCIGCAAAAGGVVQGGGAGGACMRGWSRPHRDLALLAHLRALGLTHWTPSFNQTPPLHSPSPPTATWACWPTARLVLGIDANHSPFHPPSSAAARIVPPRPGRAAGPAGAAARRAHGGGGGAGGRWLGGAVACVGAGRLVQQHGVHMAAEEVRDCWEAGWVGDGTRRRWRPAAGAAQITAGGRLPAAPPPHVRVPGARTRTTHTRRWRGGTTGRPAAASSAPRCWRRCRTGARHLPPPWLRGPCRRAQGGWTPRESAMAGRGSRACASRAHLARRGAPPAPPPCPTPRPAPLPPSRPPCASWHSPLDTKLVPMHFEKDRAGAGAQKARLGKMGALSAKQVRWAGRRAG